MGDWPYPHPKHAERFTPVTPELIALFDRMHDELGSWRAVALTTGLRLRSLRRLHDAERRKTVSQTMLDRICVTTGIGSIEEFEWFTAEDMVTLGIWQDWKPIHLQPKLTMEQKLEKRRLRRRFREKRRRYLKKELNADMYPLSAWIEAHRRPQGGNHVR